MRRKLTPPLLAVLMFWVGCAPPDEPRDYIVLGLVAEIPEDRETVTILHETIPGYMQSMTMPFAVREPGLLDEVEVGDEIRFHLVVENAAAVIDSIEKVTEYSQLLPEFKLDTLGGGSVSNSDVEGKITLVNFWASWCEPCKVEMPHFVEMKKEFPATDFDIVGVAQDPESIDAIAKIVEELNINYTIALTDGELETALGGIYGIPTTFIVGRDGWIVDKYVGLIAEEELLETVRSMLSNAETKAPD